MPSRKVVSILVVAAGLVAGIIIAFGKNAADVGGSRKNFLNLAVSGPEVKLPANEDWKKELSIFPANDSSLLQDAASSTEPLTDRLSRSLMSNYLTLKQSGELDSTSATNLVNQAAAFAESASFKTYTTGDLLISPDNGKEAVRKYGAGVGTIFKINKPSQAKNEMAVFSNILMSRDQTRTGELRDIALTYRQISASLTKIQVPSSYTEMHLAMVNKLSVMAAAVDDLSLIFEDPIKSMQGLGVYQSGYSGFMDSINKIRLKILKDGVIYKQGESGYYFYYGI